MEQGKRRRNPPDSSTKFITRRQRAAWTAAVLLVSCVCAGGTALAANCTSIANGNWNAQATWGKAGAGCVGAPGGIPGAGDNVTIGNVAHTVTVTDNRTANTLQFAAGGLVSGLTVNGGVTLTVNGSMTVTGQNAGSGVRRVDVLAGGRLAVGNDLILLGGSNNNRDVELRLGDGAGTVVTVANDLAGTAAGGNFSSAARVAITFLGQGTLNVGRNLGGNSAFTAGSGTVVLNGSNIAQTIGSYNYNHLTVAKTGAQAATTTAGTVNIQGNLAVNSGTFNLANTTVDVAGATTVTGILGITSATGTKTFDSAVTVDAGGTWNNTANEVVAFGNNLANGGTFNAGNGAHALAGNFVNGGTFNAGTGTFTVNGNFTNNGTFNAPAGTFAFVSASAQTIDGTAAGVTAFNNVTVSGGGGLTFGGSHSMTVNATLTLTAGQVRTNANLLTIASGNAIGSAGGSDFVIGNLRKRFTAIGANQTRVFEVGTDAGGAPLYAPVNLRLGQVTAIGDFTVSTTAGDHPAIAGSTLDAAQSVNRYWTLANDSVGFNANANNRIIFTFVNPGDLDAGAATGAFFASRYNAPNWTEITPSARAATTTTLSGAGITTANISGEYQLAERAAVPPPIGGFNAYDSATAAGAIAGFIRTKLAGATVSVDMIALNAAGTAIETGFFGAVRVEVLDASDNTGAIDPATGCRASWTVIQTLAPDPAFVPGDSGRKTISFTQANAYRNVRIRIGYPAAAPTSRGCSNDNFAIRPAAFASFSSSDDDWDSAGTTRALTNVSVPGGVVHKAGRPFSVRATAVNAAGTPAVTTNYNGAPEVVLAACIGGACVGTPGTFSLGAAFTGGQLASDAATYNEVGSLRIRLLDDDFAAVDGSDGSTSAERNIESAQIDVGRFVPDRFDVSYNLPVFVTACDSGGTGFTYVGERFSYILNPVITVTAKDANGNTTGNYTGALWQITGASLTGKAYSAATGSLDTSGITGTDPVIADTGAGTGTLTFSSGTGLYFTRTAPVAPFDADISLAIDVVDVDNVAFAGNPARFGQASPGNGMAFNDGKQMRFGRLTLSNASGSQLTPLQLRMETQFWNGTAFVTNTLDTCTTIAPNNIALGNYAGNLAACDTSLTTGAFNAGRSAVTLSAPGQGNDGSVTLTADLDAIGTGSTCVAGASVPVAGVNRPYLRGNWTGGAYDQNPSGRATFGARHGSDEVIHIRENF